MNKYDLEHAVTAHAKMSKAQWEGAYRQAWASYYTPEHMETVMRRSAATGNSPGKVMFLLIWFWACINLEHIHPLEGGYLRRKVRRDRRPGMKLENPLTFYPLYAADLVAKHFRVAAMALRLARLRRKLKKSPDARAYMDEALTPVVDEDLDKLEMFNNSAASRAAGDHAKKMLAKHHDHAKQHEKVG